MTRGRLRTILLCGFVLLLSILPYEIGGGLDAFIALDDDAVVTGNPMVVRGLTIEGIAWALTSFEHANWLPLTRLSHLADVSLFGLDARGHHLMSVLIHGAAAAVLFLALSRLTGAACRSALVAALFGVHPLHVESVAWISERKDVLSALFFALVLLAWERYARRGGRARYLLVTVLLALGLTAKPMLVTVPALLLLLDLWPLGRRRAPSPVPWARLLLEKVPLLALAAASAAITFFVQRAGGAVQAAERFPLGERLANALVAAATYLVKTFRPSPLAVYYPHPGAHPFWKVAGAALLLATLGALAWRERRRRPWIGVGLLWFVGMLVPVIGLVQVGAQAMADRYTYLPLTGIFIALVWSGAEVARTPRLRAAAAGGSAALLAVLFARCASQAELWRNSYTLFEHTLSVTRDNWLILNNLGNALMGDGRAEDAIPLYRETIRLRPQFPQARNNLGIALAATGRFQEAGEQFLEAIRLLPDFAEAHNNLGMLLDRLGDSRGAAARFTRALEIASEFPEALFNLASVLSRVGRRDEAVALFTEALRLKPDFLEAHHNFGNTLADMGRLEEAEAHWKEAQRLMAERGR